MPANRRHSRDELRAAMARQVNEARTALDEQARMLGGCDDPVHPLKVHGFRDYEDFVDRVARPLVEAEDDPAAEQAAMALYRQVGPYYICAAMVMMTNRLAHPVEVTEQDVLESLPESGGEAKDWAREYARNLTERLASRQATPEGDS